MKNDARDRKPESGDGVLPPRPDPAAKVAKRIRRALEPKGPLEALADLAKTIGRPMDGPKGKLF